MSYSETKTNDFVVQTYDQVSSSSAGESRVALKNEVETDCGNSTGKRKYGTFTEVEGSYSFAEAKVSKTDNSNLRAHPTTSSIPNEYKKRKQVPVNSEESIADRVQRRRSDEKEVFQSF